MSAPYTGVIEYCCERCNQALHPERMVALEYDNTDGLYYTPGTVPPEHESLGVYHFGRDCAAEQLQSQGGTP